MDRVEAQVAAYAAARGLWRAGDRLLVAVSGGGDSLALWTVLQRLAPAAGLSLAPVHVDHGLRPESAREAGWLQDLFRRRWGRELEVLAARVRPGKGESPEMAARRVRHALLARRAGGDGTLIALGHQRDDQAETVLMRVLTGTGVSGLAAMRPRQGRLVRPLLELGREELRAYLRRREVPWLEDPTNADLRILRNRLRQEVLPLLRRTVNPAVDRALAGLAERAGELADWAAAEAGAWLAAHARRRPEGWRLDGEFRALHPALKAAVLTVLAGRLDLAVDARQIRAAREGDVNWARGWRVEQLPDGGILLREPAGPLPAWDVTPPRPLTPGRIPAGGGWLVVHPLMPGQAPAPGEATVDAAPWAATGWRFWRPGDRIAPAGWGGHRKKLQDLFTDRKVPAAVRRRWPVVVGMDAGGGETVLAVPGLAQAEGAAPPPGAAGLGIRFLPPPAEPD